MNSSGHDAIWLPTPSGTDDYLGPYRIVRKVGSGGMGIVYLGADPTDKPIALKVLRDHIAEDTSARARLRRELDVLRRVRHRSVAGVVDADLDNERPYIVTEFISGPQLDTYIDEVGPLARTGLINLGHGLIGALEAIHEVGVVHRDLKPGNILLFDARPVVIDFGIAQLADDIRLTMTGLFVGTPGYVAPEVIDGAHSSPATDWWGWAATMAFAATGRPPAGKGPIEVVLDRIRRNAYDLRGIDDELMPLIVDCLRGDPARRPGPDQIKSRFSAYAAGRTASAAMPEGLAVPFTPHQVARSFPTDGIVTSQLTTAGASRPVTAMLLQPAQQSTRPPPNRALSPPLDQRRQHQVPLAAEEPATTAKTPSRRIGTICAYGLFLVALTSATPFAGMLLIFLSIATVHFVGSIVRNQERRRLAGGTPSIGITRDILTSPLRLVTSAARAALMLIVPGLIGGGIGLLGIATLPNGATALARYSQSLAIAAGAAGALLALWRFHGSLRHSTQRTVRVLAPSRLGAIVAVSITLIATLVIGVLVIGFPAVNWWPLDAQPAFFHYVR